MSSVYKFTGGKGDRGVGGGGGMVEDGVWGDKIPKYRWIFPKNIGLLQHFFQNIDAEHSYYILSVCVYLQATRPNFFEDSIIHKIHVYKIAIYHHTTYDF